MYVWKQHSHWGWSILEVRQCVFPKDIETMVCSAHIVHYDAKTLGDERDESEF